MVGKQFCHEIKSIGKTFYGNIIKIKIYIILQ